MLLFSSQKQTIGHGLLTMLTRNLTEFSRPFRVQQPSFVACVGRRGRSSIGGCGLSGRRR
jgi:hypothetical protein